MTLDLLVEKALRGETPTRAEALSLLTDEHDLLDVVAAAGRVRRHFFGYRVNRPGNRTPRSASASGC